MDGNEKVVNERKKTAALISRARRSLAFAIILMLYIYFEWKTQWTWAFLFSWLLSFFFSCVCIVVFYMFRHSHIAVLFFSSRIFNERHCDGEKDGVAFVREQTTFSTTLSVASFQVYHFESRGYCLRLNILWGLCVYASMKYVCMCIWVWVTAWRMGSNNNICRITHLPRKMYYDYDKRWMIIFFFFCFHSKKKKYLSAWDARTNARVCNADGR